MKSAIETAFAATHGIAVGKGRTPQANRTSESRRRLIEAAIKVLNDSGFAGTSTPLVALQAGVSRGRMTHHFPSKNDLLVAVIEELGQRFLDGFRIDFKRGLSLSDRIDSIVDRAWVIYGGDTYRALIQLHIGAGADRLLHEALDAVAVEAAPMELAAWQRALEGTGIATGRIERAYRHMVDQMRGIALQRFFGRKRDQEGRLNTLKLVFRALLDGSLEERAAL